MYCASRCLTRLFLAGYGAGYSYPPYEQRGREYDRDRDRDYDRGRDRDYGRVRDRDREYERGRSERDRR